MSRMLKEDVISEIALIYQKFFRISTNLIFDHIIWSYFNVHFVRINSFDKVELSVNNY